MSVHQRPRVEFLDECGLHVLAKGLDRLHHELLPADARRIAAALAAGLEPCGRGVPAAARVRAHVRRAAEAGDAAERGRGAVAREIDLQRRPDEHVARVQPRGLAQRAVRTHAAVAAGEEHVGTRGHVRLHADFGAEAVHGLDEAGFDRRDQRRMRIERPVRADLALEPEVRGVRRQQQLDGGGVEPDAVIEALHAVLGVDALDRHHRHQHLDLR